MAALKPVAVNHIGRKRYTTHRPPNDFLPTWGTVQLELLKQYFVTDARTVKGQEYIADMNGIRELWDTKVNEFDADTPIAQKCYDLAHLVAKHPSKIKVKFGPDEGMHRGGACVQALFGSKIDPTTGIIEKPCNLTFQDFADVQLIKKEDIPPQDNLQGIVQKILASEEPSQFFDELSTVEIGWIVAPKETASISKILDARRRISQQRSDNKITSVRRDAFVKIGEFCSGVILSVGEHNIPHRPDTHKVPCPFVKWESKKAVLERLNENDQNEQEAFPNCELFYSNEWIEYCKDPFNPTNKKAVYATCSFPAMDNNAITLHPPYLNDHKGLAEDPSDATYFTTWMINSVLFLPPIIHLLAADRLNTTTTETVNDSKVHETCLFTVRYSAFSTGLISTKNHGAMHHCYSSLAYSDWNVTYPNDLIAASLFIVDTLNVALTHPRNWSTKETQLSTRRMRAKLGTAASEVDTMYSTIVTRTGAIRVDDIIHNLGESSVLFSISNSFHDFRTYYN